jgi:hypothetical protein
MWLRMLRNPALLLQRPARMFALPVETARYLTRLRLRPTRRVESAGLRRSLVRECLWLRSPVHDELW